MVIVAVVAVALLHQFSDRCKCKCNCIYVFYIYIYIACCCSSLYLIDLVDLVLSLCKSTSYMHMFANCYKHFKHSFARKKQLYIALLIYAATCTYTVCSLYILIHFSVYANVNAVCNARLQCCKDLEIEFNISID